LNLLNTETTARASPATGSRYPSFAAFNGITPGERLFLAPFVAIDDGNISLVPQLPELRDWNFRGTIWSNDFNIAIKLADITPYGGFTMIQEFIFGGNPDLVFAEMPSLRWSFKNWEKRTYKSRFRMFSFARAPDPAAGLKMSRQWAGALTPTANPAQAFLLFSQLGQAHSAMFLPRLSSVSNSPWRNLYDHARG
jgi:hypothetical protein